jgi:hypothetical protein
VKQYRKGNPSGLLAIFLIFDITTFGDASAAFTQAVGSIATSIARKININGALAGKDFQAHQL